MMLLSVHYISSTFLNNLADLCNADVCYYRWYYCFITINIIINIIIIIITINIIF